MVATVTDSLNPDSMATDSMAMTVNHLVVVVTDYLSLETVNSD